MKKERIFQPQQILERKNECLGADKEEHISFEDDLWARYLT